MRANMAELPCILPEAALPSLAVVVRCIWGTMLVVLVLFEAILASG